jgi:hypothetical protein
VILRDGNEWIARMDEWLDSIVDRATRTPDVSVRIAEEAG